MNNILSYCGLTDARMRASEKDLPVTDSTSHGLYSILGSTKKIWCIFDMQTSTSFFQEVLAPHFQQKTVFSKCHLHNCLIKISKWSPWAQYVKMFILILILLFCITNTFSRLPFPENRIKNILYIKTDYKHKTKVIVTYFLFHM